MATRSDDRGVGDGKLAGVRDGGLAGEDGELAGEDGGLGGLGVDGELAGEDGELAGSEPSFT